MSHQGQPTILIIVGVTGDLAQRKVLPALAELAAAKKLPTNFALVGVSRQAQATAASILSDVPGSTVLAAQTQLVTMNLAEAADYDRLAERLAAIEAQWGTPAQRLFYISVPPQVSLPIIQLLGKTGLAAVSHTKLLLEKPFGLDTDSAQDMITEVDTYFAADQVYRIDHYLAKPGVVALSQATQRAKLFAGQWNYHDIAAIDIVATEAIGIEGRAAFYEQTGALRDIIQSHLLQLAAVVLAPSVAGSAQPGRLQALQHLALPAAQPVTAVVKRGQYQGYRQEVANPRSQTETAVVVTLASANPVWRQVPIRLMAGKALNKPATYVSLTSRHAGPPVIINVSGDGAYAQVLLSAIAGQRFMFVSHDEVMQTWRILGPILHTWEQSADDLVSYREGSAVTKLLP